MLSVEGLQSRYGRIEALRGVDLEVHEGEIVAVVGANGAGKSTLLRCLSGVQPCHGGKVTFRGEDVVRVPAHRRVGLGLAQSPEGRQIFTTLTVEDNLRLGAYSRRGDRVRDEMEQVYEMFPVLQQRHDHLAGTLSGGQQQMLAIGRALMSRPRCLLLDEPSMGLAPFLAAQVLEAVKTLRDTHGVTVLLVEQNAFAALNMADRGYVMEIGRITMSGPAATLIADPRIREAYLGL